MISNPAISHRSKKPAILPVHSLKTIFQVKIYHKPGIGGMSMVWIIYQSIETKMFPATAEVAGLWPEQVRFPIE